MVAAAAAVDELPVAGWPAAAPRLREPSRLRLLCWTWAADGPPGGAVSVGRALPVPAGTVPVALAQADGAGSRAGRGGGGRRRGRAGRGDRAPGRAWWLVSATGVGYPVVDAETAAAIGITAAEPAPEAVLHLLPDRAGRSTVSVRPGGVLDRPPAPG